MSEIIQYLSLSGLLPLASCPLRSIHVVADARIASSMWLSNTRVCVHTQIPRRRLFFLRNLLKAIFIYFLSYKNMHMSKIQSSPYKSSSSH